MPPSLTVILRACNVEATLRRQVEQLLDFLPDLTDHYRIAVVEIGSTDLTPDIARELAREYPQVAIGSPEDVRACQDTAPGNVVIETGSQSGLDLARISRIWRETAQKNRPMPSLTPGPPLLPDGLLERLSQWGEQLGSAAPASLRTVPTRLPSSFVCHLREVMPGN